MIKGNEFFQTPMKWVNSDESVYLGTKFGKCKFFVN